MEVILQHNSQAIINHLGGLWQRLNNNDNDPLTTDEINALPYPDQGVKDRLNTAYQQYQQEQNQNERMRNNAKNHCKDLQKATIDSYAEQCHSWKQKNERWSAAYALRLMPQQQQGRHLEQGVQQYRATIQQPIGPQLDNGIRIGHLNIRSLLTRNLENGRPDKFDNLQIILRAHGFHVFVVGESWVKGVDSQLLAIPGYNLVGRLDRDYPGPRFNHGGLLVYARHNMAANVVRQGNVLVPGVHPEIPNSLLQYVYINFQNAQQHTDVLAVYNPPFAGNQKAMSTLFQQLNPNNLPNNLVIIGDINIDIFGERNLDYQNAIFGHQQGQLSFQKCIWEGTRNGTLLDHIYFKQGNNIPQGQRAYILESGVIPPGDGFQLGGFADHKIIYCTVGNFAQQNFQTPQNNKLQPYNQQPQSKQQELNNGNNALDLNFGN